MPEEINDGLKDEIDFKSLIPQNKLKLFLILGCLLIAGLVIAAGILGVYIAQYKTATYYKDYIDNNCQCGSDNNRFILPNSLKVKYSLMHLEFNRSFEC